MFHLVLDFQKEAFIALDLWVEIAVSKRVRVVLQGERSLSLPPFSPSWYFQDFLSLECLFYQSF